MSRSSCSASRHRKRRGRNSGPVGREARLSGVRHSLIVRRQGPRHIGHRSAKRRFRRASVADLIDRSVAAPVARAGHRLCHYYDFVRQLCDRRRKKASLVLNNTISASRPPGGVAMLPPRAVTTKFCGDGDTTSALSGPDPTGARRGTSQSTLYQSQAFPGGPWPRPPRVFRHRNPRAAVRFPSSSREQNPSRWNSSAPFARGRQQFGPPFHPVLEDPPRLSEQA